eukprot:PRCOL_00002160-RA
MGKRGGRRGGTGGGEAANELKAPATPKLYEPGWAEGEEPCELPRSIHDIDNGAILGYGADLGEGHPGFHDEAYKQRRVAISKLAKAHVPGTPCPRVEYSDDELATWTAVYDHLTALYPTHACERFNAAFGRFGFKRDEVPQLADCADVIFERTGWTIRPTAGLLHPRDFLAGLAFKTFHSTQYVRHGSKPMYTPEPDVVHEILGHVPMLADPEFASLMHAIGVASLGASKRDLWHLTKVYWYTVEFGLVREADRSLKAFGAGVLSSYGELEYSLSKEPEIRELDPFLVMPKIDYCGGFQDTYFFLNSFEEGRAALLEFAQFMKRPGVQEVELPDVAVHGTQPDDRAYTPLPT